jgi:hypothetical protein
MKIIPSTLNVKKTSTKFHMVVTHAVDGEITKFILWWKGIQENFNALIIIPRHGTTLKIQNKQIHFSCVRYHYYVYLTRLITSSTEGKEIKYIDDLSDGEREKYERVNCECTIVERIKKRRKNIVVHCLPGVSPAQTVFSQSWAAVRAIHEIEKN